MRAPSEVLIGDVSSLSTRRKITSRFRRSSKRSVAEQAATKFDSATLLFGLRRNRIRKLFFRRILRLIPMRTTIVFVVLTAVAGCTQTGSDGPVLIVSASYPGANAQTVADSVAAPLEQQINGTEDLVRIESEAHNDGGYVAILR